MLEQLTNQHLHRRLFKIKGNEPVLLNDPDVVWLLQSGSMALFTIAVNNGIPEGARHYLSSIEKPGEALFGTALSPQPGRQPGLLAVAIEETQLLKISLQDLGQSVVQGDTKDTILLEGWIHRLGTVISSVSTPTANSVPVVSDHYLTLTQGQTFQARPGTVTWVKVQQGRAKWLGLTEFTLDPTSAFMPLGTGTWLEADGVVELAIADTAEIQDMNILLEGLIQLHASCRRCLDIKQQQEAQAAFFRFQERIRLNHQVTGAAMGELAAVLQPQSTAAIALEGTPLLIAAGAVGRALGVTICPPSRSEELNRVKEPLEAIARASQIRTRRVLLTGNWWQQDNGPLLAYTLHQHPVALLPVSTGRYELFDPVEQIRLRVNSRVAADLAPEAYMFYRPITDKIKRPLDILLFGIRGHSKDVVLMILAGLAATVLGMVTPQATAILIDSAIPDSDRGLVWQIGLALFAVAFGQSAFELARGVVSLRVENAADSSLQPAVWDRLLSLKPSFFRQYPSGDIQSRVLAVGGIRRQLSGATLRTIFTGVFALLNLGLMFAYSWQLAIVATALAGMSVFATLVSSFLSLRRIRPLQQLDGLLLGLTVQLINGVAKLRVAAAEERAFAYWGRSYSQEKKLKASAQRVDDSLAVFNETLPTISSVLLFWFAINLMQSPEAGLAVRGSGLTAGTFLAFSAAFGIFIQGATSLSNTLATVLNVVPLWERAQTIIQSPPETNPSQADPGRLTGRVKLEHVTFRYRDDGPLTLDDVTLHAEPGEFIGVVGPSGSGKSTVFRLLLGFENPASGTVYYDGQDLAGLDVHAVRRQLGVVLQNGRINTGSLFELITGGALVTMEEAWEAAQNAGFADDVKQMPMGMHTVISEGATNLSGGQRQRLLIARALVLKPKIILMDEATSALDNNTQSIVTASLDKMNATRIVIAHRLSTIRNADRIYVIEAGRVVQSGTFDQLVTQEGIFARLVARQLE